MITAMQPTYHKAAFCGKIAIGRPAKGKLCDEKSPQWNQVPTCPESQSRRIIRERRDERRLWAAARINPRTGVKSAKISQVGA